MTISKWFSDEVTLYAFVGYDSEQGPTGTPGVQLQGYYVSFDE